MSFNDMDVETLWMNGDIIPWEDAHIHALSHGANYGSGVFDGTRAYETPDGPAVFRHDDHIDRLEDSAKLLDIDFDYEKATLKQAARELIRQNDLGDAYIRQNISYGYHSLGVAPPADCPVNTLVAAFPWGTYLGEDALNHGARVQLSPYRRIHSSQFPTAAKTMGIYTIAMLSKQRAIANGYDEAILLDMEGNVAEGSGENLFIVDGETLYTPGLDASILPGITRRSIMTLAEDLGYTVEEKRITTGELFTADELFFCGTAAEITPIREVDNTQIGDGEPGTITQELQDTFFEVVRGKRDEYSEWLDYV